MWSDLAHELCFFSNSRSFVVGIRMNVKFIASRLSTVYQCRLNKEIGPLAGPVNWLGCPVSQYIVYCVIRDTLPPIVL